ncbi:hypothetical protein XELAEV_18026106mg [Xenopus laevis]|uniref:Uncharacterized protein n=1 Tax=Xenopus laevis TaxID=8355 RepID=A0A974HIN8_XENLA|nr:hypothetical protein XELAEV_18026106mg [Xenopus laevis]
MDDAILDFHSDRQEGMQRRRVLPAVLPQPPNLKKIIARRVLPQANKAGTFPYNRCSMYKYIQIHRQKVYTIQDYYLCASSNVVDMNTCTKCSTGGNYIGETGHKIKTKSCDTQVGQHFCNQNHWLQDIIILKREKKIYEFKCMELFNRALI